MPQQTIERAEQDTSTQAARSGATMTRPAPAGEGRRHGPAASPPLKKRAMQFAEKHMPPALGRVIKRFGVYVRYSRQAARCREAYRQFGDRYPQKVLFVAGLPKSGTTWLEKMITTYPGFHDLLIPDVAAHELRTGGSHDYDLPDDMFDRFRDMLVLTKMHVHGSQHNVDVLKKAGVRYIVQHRDLRDVAVSYHFYVCKTPWHPEHPLYKGLELEAGLRRFGETLLPEYKKWVESWNLRRDPEMSIEITYEQMLQDAVGVMTRVAEHFQLDSSPETVRHVVEANSFERLSGGRKPGEASAGSFFRSGTSGGWRKHFTPALREQYKAVIGQSLIDWGYERDLEW